MSNTPNNLGISIQPNHRWLVPGSAITFLAAGYGSPPPTVQWQKSIDSGVTFTDIVGATTTYLRSIGLQDRNSSHSTYTFTPTLDDNTSKYRAIFTNSSGSVTTQSATLSVQPGTTVNVVLADVGATDQVTIYGCTIDITLELDGVIAWNPDGGSERVDFEFVTPHEIAIRRLNNTWCAITLTSVDSPNYTFHFEPLTQRQLFGEKWGMGDMYVGDPVGSPGNLACHRLVDNCAAAGCTAISFLDGHIVNWQLKEGGEDAATLAGIKDIRDYCHSKGIKFIASVPFSGSSTNLDLTLDGTSTAEGMPVNEQLFEITQVGDHKELVPVDNALTVLPFTNTGFDLSPNWWGTGIGTHNWIWYQREYGSAYYTSPVLEMVNKDTILDHNGQSKSCLHVKLLGEIPWEADHVYAQGALLNVYKARSSGVVAHLLLRAIVGGTSASTEPSWDTDAITDGGVTWHFCGEDNYNGGMLCQQQEFTPTSDYKYIHISFWYKLKDFIGTGPKLYSIVYSRGAVENHYGPTTRKNIAFQGLANGASTSTPITTGWLQEHLIVNTQDLDYVNFYLQHGAMEAGSELWIDDFKVEIGDLTHILRRGDTATPIKMTSLDRSVTYVEGVDYSSPSDPHLKDDWEYADSAVTTTGGVKGGHPGVPKWHEAPANMQVLTTPGSHLKDLQVGDRVLFSYYHTLFRRYRFGAKDDGPVACVSDPLLLARYEEHIPRIRDAYQPDGYHISTDEMSGIGYDAACSHSADEAWFNNTNCQVEAIRRLDPGKIICIWNDMIDPYHNGTKYGMGSDYVWTAASRLSDELIIINWCHNALYSMTVPSEDLGYRRSIQLFADAGLKQMPANFDGKSTTAIQALLNDQSYTMLTGSSKGSFFSVWYGTDGYECALAPNWAIPLDTLPVALPLNIFITLQPVDYILIDGQQADFTSASSDASLTIQWQVSTPNVQTWTNINGATSSTYSFTAHTSDNNNQYRAVFTNTFGYIVSNIATLTSVLLHTWYVDYSEGLDSNDGRYHDNSLGGTHGPLQHIYHASTIARPGDTVYLIGGIHKFNYNDTKRVLSPLSEGTLESPVIYKNYNSNPVICSGGAQYTWVENEVEGYWKTVLPISPPVYESGVLQYSAWDVIGNAYSMGAGAGVSNGWLCADIARSARTSVTDTTTGWYCPAAGKIVPVLGSGCEVGVTTNSSGAVTDIRIINGGTGYPASSTFALGLYPGWFSATTDSSGIVISVAAIVGSVCTANMSDVTKSTESKSYASGTYGAALYNARFEHFGYCNTTNQGTTRSVYPTFIDTNTGANEGIYVVEPVSSELESPQFYTARTTAFVFNVAWLLYQSADKSEWRITASILTAGDSSALVYGDGLHDVTSDDYWTNGGAVDSDLINGNGGVYTAHGRNTGEVQVSGCWTALADELTDLPAAFLDPTIISATTLITPNINNPFYVNGKLLYDLKTYNVSTGELYYKSNEVEPVINPNDPDTGVYQISSGSPINSSNDYIVLDGIDFRLGSGWTTIEGTGFIVKNCSFKTVSGTFGDGTNVIYENNIFDFIGQAMIWNNQSQIWFNQWSHVLYSSLTASVLRNNLFGRVRGGYAFQDGGNSTFISGKVYDNIVYPSSAGMWFGGDTAIITNNLILGVREWWRGCDPSIGHTASSKALVFNSYGDTKDFTIVKNFFENKAIDSGAAGGHAIENLVLDRNIFRVKDNSAEVAWFYEPEHMAMDNNSWFSTTRNMIILAGPYQDYQHTYDEFHTYYIGRTPPLEVNSTFAIENTVYSDIITNAVKIPIFAGTNTYTITAVNADKFVLSAIWPYAAGASTSTITSVSIKADGDPTELAPSLSDPNWTGTHGWSANGTSLVRVGDGSSLTGTETPVGDTSTPSIGTTYTVVITASAVYGLITFSYGGGSAATAYLDPYGCTTFLESNPSMSEIKTKYLTYALAKGFTPYNFVYETKSYTADGADTFYFLGDTGEVTFGATTVTLTKVDDVVYWNGTAVTGTPFVLNGYTITYIGLEEIETGLSGYMFNVALVIPTIALQPGNRPCPPSSVVDGRLTTFTAKAYGINISTQWYVNSGGGWSAINGATSSTYSFTALTADNNKQYRVIFTNSTGSATSSTALLRIPANYYVSTAGSNSNSGTIDLPWATFYYATHYNLVPGDIINIRAGSYYYERMDPITSGIAGFPIAVRPYENEEVFIYLSKKSNLWVDIGNNIYTLDIDAAGITNYFPFLSYLNGDSTGNGGSGGSGWLTDIGENPWMGVNLRAPDQLINPPETLVGYGIYYHDGNYSTQTTGTKIFFRAPDNSWTLDKVKNNILIGDASKQLLCTSHWSFLNLNFRNVYDFFHLYKSLDYCGPSHISISGCTFKCGTQGAVLGEVDNLLIENSEISGIGPELSAAKVLEDSFTLTREEGPASATLQIIYLKGVGVRIIIEEDSVAVFDETLANETIAALKELIENIPHYSLTIKGNPTDLVKYLDATSATSNTIPTSLIPRYFLDNASNPAFKVVTSINHWYWVDISQDTLTTTFDIVDFIDSNHIIPVNLTKPGTTTLEELADFVSAADPTYSLVIVGDKTRQISTLIPTGGTAGRKYAMVPFKIAADGLSVGRTGLHHGLYSGGTNNVIRNNSIESCNGELMSWRWGENLKIYNNTCVNQFDILDGEHGNGGSLDLASTGIKFVNNIFVSNGNLNNWCFYGSTIDAIFCHNTFAAYSNNNLIGSLYTTNQNITLKNNIFFHKKDTGIASKIFVLNATFDNFIVDNNVWYTEDLNGNIAPILVNLNSYNWTSYAAYYNAVKTGGSLNWGWEDNSLNVNPLLDSNFKPTSPATLALAGATINLIGKDQTHTILDESSIYVLLEKGGITEVSVLTPGDSYVDGHSKTTAWNDFQTPVATTGGSGVRATVVIETNYGLTTTGQVTGVSIWGQGLDYQVGDVLTLVGGDNNATIQVTEVLSPDIAYIRIGSTSYPITLNTNGDVLLNGNIIAVDGEVTLSVCKVKYKGTEDGLIKFDVSALVAPVFSVNGTTVGLQPGNQPLIDGRLTTFAAKAYGIEGSVQWWVSTNSGDSWSDIDSAAAKLPTYSFTALNADNNNQYKAIFTNSAGSVTSSTVLLRIPTDYFISTVGSDSNPGTIDLPWATFKYACGKTTLVPGDTINFRAGTYYNTHGPMYVKGIKDYPITVRAYQDEIVNLWGADTYTEWTGPDVNGIYTLDVDTTPVLKGGDVLDDTEILPGLKDIGYNCILGYIDGGQHHDISCFIDINSGWSQIKDPNNEYDYTPNLYSYDYLNNPSLVDTDYGWYLLDYVLLNKNYGAKIYFHPPTDSFGSGEAGVWTLADVQTKVWVGFGEIYPRDYWEFYNLNFKYANTVFRPYWATNLKIRSCSVSHVAKMGILSGFSNLLIEDCSFDGMGPPRTLLGISTNSFKVSRSTVTSPAPSTATVQVLRGNDVVSYQNYPTYDALCTRIRIKENTGGGVTTILDAVSSITLRFKSLTDYLYIKAPTGSTSATMSVYRDHWRGASISITRNGSTVVHAELSFGSVDSETYPPKNLLEFKTWAATNLSGYTVDIHGDENRDFYEVLTCVNVDILNGANFPCHSKTDSIEITRANTSGVSFATLTAVTNFVVTENSSPILTLSLAGHTSLNLKTEIEAIGALPAHTYSAIISGDSSRSLTDLISLTEGWGAIYYANESTSPTTCINLLACDTITELQAVIQNLTGYTVTIFDGNSRVKYLSNTSVVNVLGSAMDTIITNGIVVRDRYFTYSTGRTANFPGHTDYRRFNAFYTEPDNFVCRNNVVKNTNGDVFVGDAGTSINSHIYNNKLGGISTLTGSYRKIYNNIFYNDKDASDANYGMKYRPIAMFLTNSIIKNNTIFGNVTGIGLISPPANGGNNSKLTLKNNVFQLKCDGVPNSVPPPYGNATQAFDLWGPLMQVTLPELTIDVVAFDVDYNVWYESKEDGSPIVRGLDMFSDLNNWRYYYGNLAFQHFRPVTATLEVPAHTHSFGYLSVDHYFNYPQFPNIPGDSDVYRTGGGVRLKYGWEINSLNVDPVLDVNFYPTDSAALALGAGAVLNLIGKDQTFTVTGEATVSVLLEHNGVDTISITNSGTGYVTKSSDGSNSPLNTTTSGNGIGCSCYLVAYLGNITYVYSSGHGRDYQVGDVLTVVGVLVNGVWHGNSDATVTVETLTPSDIAYIKIGSTSYRITLNTNGDVLLNGNIIAVDDEVDLTGYRVKRLINNDGLYQFDITIIDVPTITLQPTNHPLIDGHLTTFTAEASGLGVSVQWQSQNISNSVALRDSLVAHYKLNDYSDNTDVLDSSSNSYVATCGRNTNLISSVGKLDKSFLFNGTTDYIDAGTSPIGTQGCTIAAWVFINGTGEGNAGRIVDNGSLYFFTQNTNFKFYNNGYTVSSPINAIALAKYCHVAVTCTASGIVNFYVNGKLLGVADRGTANQTTAAMVAATTNLFIGNNAGNSATFNGKIDDLRVYNTALSVADILTIYNCTIGTETDNFYYTWTDIPGATSETYSFIANKVDNNSQYRAVFTNSAGSVTSDSVYLHSVLGADKTITIAPLTDSRGRDRSVLISAIMTSATTPVPFVVTASSRYYDINYYPYNYEHAAFDDHSDTMWISAASLPAWLSIDLGDSYVTKCHKSVATKYSIQSYQYGALDQMPKDWTFLGSNTGEFTADAVVLDTQVGIVWTAVSQTIEFSIINTNSYRYYRLNITAANGATNARIPELKIFADSLDFQYHFLSYDFGFRDYNDSYGFKSVIVNPPTAGVLTYNGDIVTGPQEVSVVELDVGRDCGGVLGYYSETEGTGTFTFQVKDEYGIIDPEPKTMTMVTSETAIVGNITPVSESWLKIYDSLLGITPPHVSMPPQAGVICNATFSSGIATITLTLASANYINNLQIGQQIVVSGVGSGYIVDVSEADSLNLLTGTNNDGTRTNHGYNGAFVITDLTSETISYALDSTPGIFNSSTGTVTATINTENITGAVWVDGIVTFATTENYVQFLQIGQTITVHGVTPRYYNGTYVVDSLATTTFTAIPMLIAGSTGVVINATWSNNIATITTSAALVDTLTVGQKIVVANVVSSTTINDGTGIGYNGTWEITDKGVNPEPPYYPFFSYAILSNPGTYDHCGTISSIANSGYVLDEWLGGPFTSFTWSNNVVTFNMPQRFIDNLSVGQTVTVTDAQNLRYGLIGTHAPDGYSNTYKVATKGAGFFTCELNAYPDVNWQQAGNIYSIRPVDPGIWESGGTITANGIGVITNITWTAGVAPILNYFTVTTSEEFVSTLSVGQQINIVNVSPAGYNTLLRVISLGTNTFTCQRGDVFTFRLYDPGMYVSGGMVYATQSSFRYFLQAYSVGRANGYNGIIQTGDVGYGSKIQSASFFSLMAFLRDLYKSANLKYILQTLGTASGSYNGNYKLTRDDLDGATLRFDDGDPCSWAEGMAVDQQVFEIQDGKIIPYNDLIFDTAIGYEGNISGNLEIVNFGFVNTLNWKYGYVVHSSFSQDLEVERHAEGLAAYPTVAINNTGSGSTWGGIWGQYIPFNSKYKYYEVTVWVKTENYIGTGVQLWVRQSAAYAFFTSAKIGASTTTSNLEWTKLHLYFSTANTGDLDNNRVFELRCITGITGIVNLAPTLKAVNWTSTTDWLVTENVNLYRRSNNTPGTMSPTVPIVVVPGTEYAITINSNAACLGTNSFTFGGGPVTTILSGQNTTFITATNTDSLVLNTVGGTPGNNNSVIISEVSIEAVSSKVWFDDWQINPTPLTHMLRRDETPISLTSEDRMTVYTEGADYTGSSAVYPELSAYIGTEISIDSRTNAQGLLGKVVNDPHIKLNMYSGSGFINSLHDGTYLGQGITANQTVFDVGGGQNQAYLFFVPFTATINGHSSGWSNIATTISSTYSNYWTMTNGWSIPAIPGNTLVKTAQGSIGTATSIQGHVPVPGLIYTVTIIASEVTGVVTYTLGGSSANALLTGTNTVAITATQANRLVITGAADSTATITSLSIRLPEEHIYVTDVSTGDFPGRWTVIRGTPSYAYPSDVNKYIVPDVQVRHHDAPPPMAVVDTGFLAGLPNGTKLLFSWFFAIPMYDTTNTWGKDQFSLCLNPAGYKRDFESEAAYLVQNCQVDAYFLQLDEKWCYGWDTCCGYPTAANPGCTSGDAMANNINSDMDSLKAASIAANIANPDIPQVPVITIWQDMIDPYHNAGPHSARRTTGDSAVTGATGNPITDKSLIQMNWNTYSKKTPQFFGVNGFRTINIGIINLIGAGPDHLYNNIGGGLSYWHRTNLATNPDLLGTPPIFPVEFAQNFIIRAITITLQPTDQYFNDGDTVSFIAAASGNPEPTVQWQISTDGGITFQDIAEATAATYTFIAHHTPHF